MNKDQENSNDKSKQDNLQADFTVDLEVNESKDLKAGQSTIQGSTAQGSTSQSEGVTSISISSIGQTMDITPSDQSSGSGTLDLEQINGQTVDLDQQPSQDPDDYGGTRLISPSMTPFGGKVFEPSATPQPPDGDGGTRLVGQDQNPYGQTMDINVQEESGPAQAPDRTMLLSDSQQGSQAGSSSLAGKSSYDQTMDLADSASESKSGSDIKTGQSINASVRSNMKSIGDSKQYLQAERAIASDSIFDRIQARSISYTIDWNDKTKDYQINQKIDSKTGKLDLHVLGKGGMGLVYLATQNSVNRPVALKIIRKDKQNDTFSKQFFYEAEITALLEHPNITPIYELGKTPDQTYFYTMKYIQGTPWEKKIRSNSIEENLEIFDKLCDAIAFAHSKNILHMDIKPDNVQLGEFGEVYAVDWGVASDLKRPESVRCAGTWQWISPEVARGEKSRIGKGSDIYLLGGILFQIVTGHHPRVPKDPSEKLSDPALRKAAINNIIQPTDCKDPMVAVALKALATEPKDRYAKVEHLQEAIHAIQKERAAIKSSQELTQRAIVLASQATEQGDYGRFNQSLFGLKDAIELWDKNPDAPNELKKVRLAYGQCAFDKGDYDLALQTLDRQEPQEDQLYVKAEQAQTAVKLRAERFRLLRNAFIASLVLGTGIVGFLWIKAEQARSNAVEAQKEAIAAQKQEKKARIAAVESQEKAIAAQKEEEKARIAAVKSQEKAIAAQKEEEKAKNAAVEAEKLAVAAREQEEKAKVLAVAARQTAELQLAKTQLTEIVSQLGLARSSISESNPSGAFALLTGINNKVKEYINEKRAKDTLANDSKDTQENALITKIPDLDNWSKNRIAFLDNADNKTNPQIKVFDLKNGKDRIGFEFHKSAIAINPVKSNLTVANPNGDIYQIPFDGSEPQRIPNELSRIPAMPPKRIRPSKDGNRLFLSFERASNPIVLVDLEKQTQLDFQIELPKSNDLVAVSPRGTSIATSKGGTVWFVRNKAGAKGCTLTTHEKAEQLHWLNDELILILNENNGRYFLSLVAPFAKSDKENPISKRVALKEDVVRFAILDENLPTAAEDLNLGALLSVETTSNSEEKVLQEFSKILESLQFLFGFGDGNLAQAKLKKSTKATESQEDKNLGPDIENWDLKDKFKLTRKHYHKIEEIQVQYESIQGQNDRRILTKASEEQAVQIWNLNDDADSDNKNDTALTESVSHLLSLAGLPLQEQSEDQGIKLAEFTKEGKVLLVNSEWKAQLLDVDEQLSRQRFALETPFRSSTYEETASKWLFDTNDQKALSIDGYGAITKYDLVRGSRIPMDQKQGHWRITQNTNPFKEGEVEKIVLLDSQGDVQYWGHSPFAEVRHYALSPDGERAVSIAMIPAEKSVYFVPRNTDKLAESLRFKEVCIWKIDKRNNNHQFIERLVFQSDSTDLLVSPLDERRFILSNSQTLSILETGAPSKISDEMATKAVRFCVPNPIYKDCHAFFRVDGISGTGWIGNILSEQASESERQCWFSVENNRHAFDTSAPITGCWSSDGLRLYVLDSQAQIRRYVLDPNAGSLSVVSDKEASAFLSSDNPIPNPVDQKITKYKELAGLLKNLQSNPQKVIFGISSSQAQDGKWSDELYIAINDQLGSGEAGSKNAIHARFKNDAVPQWDFDPQVCENQTTYLDFSNSLSALCKSKITNSQNPDLIHQPLHATSDAQGNRILLLYPKSILCLSSQDGKTSIWHRIERQSILFDENPSHFSLSPDGTRLAIVDSKGLHLCPVTVSSTDVSIGPAQTEPAHTSVTFFAWDPEGNQASYGFVRQDGSYGYCKDDKLAELGNLSELREKDMKPINLAEIQRIWFFKESLLDKTKDKNTKDGTEIPKVSTTLRYLAVQCNVTEENDQAKPKKNNGLDQAASILFVRLPHSDPIAEPTKEGDDRGFEKSKFVFLPIDRAFNKIAVNPNGGILVTGNGNAEVGVYFVSPYWEFSKIVFDANSEPDSKIEGLCFAQDGKTLVVSNANNHVFCLRTDSPKMDSAK